MRFRGLEGFVWVTAGTALVAGCASGGRTGTSVKDPKILLVEACRPGEGIRRVRGSVWIKAKSSEASGQFPANVSADGPERLRLEVTNLLGGTEAVINVEGRKFTIEVPHHQERNQQGMNTWGGIPLEWANSLFLGRVPCPGPDGTGDARASTNADGDLVVETKPTLARDAERFVYSFRDYAGKPWPRALHWERQGTGALTVDFKFEDPEDKTRSPKRWEAKSSQGEVKVRWKDRELLP